MVWPESEVLPVKLKLLLASLVLALAPAYAELTLKSDFVNSPSLVSDIGPTYSITRATNATSTDDSGNLVVVTSGNARFPGSPFSGGAHTGSGTSNGLLIEEARTTIATWTEDASNAAWVKSNITVGSDSVTAPDGSTNTNCRLTATAGNGTILQTVTSASANRAYSVYLKRITGTGDIDLTTDGGTTWTTKTLTSEWQRFDISQAAVTDPSFGVRIVTSGDEIDFWGSQQETGLFATSYIANNSATASVTRNADAIDPNTDTSWYTSTTDGGSIYIHGSILPGSLGKGEKIPFFTSGGDNVYTRLNNTNSNHVSIGLGATAILSGSAPSDAENGTRIVFAFAENDCIQYLDGSANGTDTSTNAVTGSITSLYIGRSIGGSYWNGLIKEIRYYNTRLTNTQLEDMSNGEFPPELTSKPIKAIMRGVSAEVNDDETDFCAFIPDDAVDSGNVCNMQDFRVRRDRDRRNGQDNPDSRGATGSDSGSDLYDLDAVSGF
jgi:hypothetical protein